MDLNKLESMYEPTEKSKKTVILSAPKGSLQGVEE